MSDNSSETVATLSPLEDDALERLDDALSEETLGEEAPDLIYASGFMLALAIAPKPISAQRWIAELFDGEPAFPSDKERNEALALLEQLQTNSASILEQGNWVELPFDTELDEEGETEAAIEDWCAGFMQAVFMDESAWFEQDEAHVAALLLPFMALSGLFDDEPEIEEMIADDSQFSTLAEQLPELMLDLYLHFRVPPEPAKPNKGGPGKAQGGKAKSRR